jgi:5'-3' exonuclease
MSATLLLVDFLNLAFAVTGGHLGSPERVARGVTRGIEVIAESCGATHVSLALDAAGPTFRSPILKPSYMEKRRRRVRRRLARESDASLMAAPAAVSGASHFDAEPPRRRIWKTIELLTEAGIPAYGLDGYEADDILATLAHLAEPDFERVIIASSDRDLRAAVTAKTSVMSFPNGLAGMHLHARPSYGHRSRADRGSSGASVALCGSGGNHRYSVSGAVDGRTADRLLGQFGSVDALYERIDEVDPIGLRTRLLDKEADVRLRAKFIPLQIDLPLTFDAAGGRLPIARPGADGTDWYQGMTVINRPLGERLT